MTAGSIFKNLRGSLTKFQAERVLAILSRWISDERAGLKEKKKKKQKTKRREREGWCLLPEVGKKATATMAGRAEGSPEQADGKLRCTVFDSESTRRERRAMRVRS